MGDQELEALVEGVVLGLHVGVLDQLGQDVLVEGASKVALQVLVVIDGLCDHPAHELEVVQVVVIGRVGLIIDHVGYLVPGGRLEEGVHGVKDLLADDHVPKKQQYQGQL